MPVLLLQHRQAIDRFGQPVAGSQVSLFVFRSYSAQPETAARHRPWPARHRHFFRQPVVTFKVETVEREGDGASASKQYARRH